MDIERAKEILTILADGVNPVTGEILPDTDSANQAEVVRALYVAINSLNTKASKEKSKMDGPENAGKPWTEDDDILLCSMFDKKCSKSDMIDHFKRTQGAIVARLVRLGKIQNSSEF